MENIQYKNISIRVKEGKAVEKKIIEGLIREGKLNIEESSSSEDRIKKIDCWITYGNTINKIPAQIKYRETGDDLLFEVFYLFEGWNNPLNKYGRDIIGESKEYIVLLRDKETVLIVPVVYTKLIIDTIIRKAMSEKYDFNTNNIYKFNISNANVELRVYRDRNEGRRKMVCFIPPQLFITQGIVRTYKIKV